MEKGRVLYMNDIYINVGIYVFVVKVIKEGRILYLY